MQVYMPSESSGPSIQVSGNQEEGIFSQDQASRFSQDQADAAKEETVP